MRLLITGAWKDAPAHFEELCGCGHEILWMPDERGQLPDGWEQSEGMICNSLFMHHPMDRFPALRFVQLTSAGMDRVPVAELRRRGIAVYNARDVYSIPMAEFVLCGVLQLYKHSRFFGRNQDASRWEKHRGLLELCGRTVCIVGIGGVASACAVRFRAFGCRVLGVNIHPRPQEHFDYVFPMEELEQALPQADIVVLAVPLTEQTRCLMNRERFRAMKRGAILVNVARGGLVVQQDLIDALKSHLGGAVLDVFEEEPLPEDDPLWKMDHVLISPHNSFTGDGNTGRLYNLLIRNLADYLSRME